MRVGWGPRVWRGQLEKSSRDAYGQTTHFLMARPISVLPNPISEPRCSERGLHVPITHMRPTAAKIRQTICLHFEYYHYLNTPIQIIILKILPPKLKFFR